MSTVLSAWIFTVSLQYCQPEYSRRVYGTVSLNINSESTALLAWIFAVSLQYYQPEYSRRVYSTVSLDIHSSVRFVLALSIKRRLKLQRAIAHPEVPMYFSFDLWIPPLSLPPSLPTPRRSFCLRRNSCSGQMCKVCRWYAPGRIDVWTMDSSSSIRSISMCATQTNPVYSIWC